MDYGEFIEITQSEIGLDVHAARPLTVDDFLRRVAEREDVDLETAERHARAVFFALAACGQRRRDFRCRR